MRSVVCPSCRGLVDRPASFGIPRGLRRILAPPGFAQLRIELVEIGLNLLAAAFVDELPPPHASRVGQAHPGGSQLALDVVDAFAEHDLYPVGALAVDHDIQRLPGFGYA